jgi:hypothetical protein
MRLMQPRFPSGHTDVSAFSAASCVLSAPTVRARRNGATPFRPATSLARRGRFSFFTQWNRHAQ